jgi:predicted dienelactone hydrolase
MRTPGALLVVCGLALSIGATTVEARSPIDTRCIVASGGAAARCVREYAKAVAACRSAGDEACESALRTPGGGLAVLLAATEKPIRDGCSDEAADRLTSLLGVDDLVYRTAQVCRKWGDDFVDTAFADDTAGLSTDERKCQRLVVAQLARVRDAVAQAFGRRCFVAEFAGRACDRAARDRRAAGVRARARRLIARRCGSTFDALGLVSSASGAMLDDRIDVLTDTVAIRSRHLAERVYPPLSLGPTAFFGPHPVGVRTIDLVDASRPNPVGPGSRTLTTEIYYPSSTDAVAGVPRDTIELFGIPLIPNPSYRNVARAPGTFPLIVYSHGGGGMRFENALKLEHLASHGFIVVSANHPGSDLLHDAGDPDAFVNRPLDLRFLIDRFLAFDVEAGHFLEGAIDPDRIGVTGWSLGGYATFALAIGPFGRGTFTDARVKAIMPLDGSAQLVIESSGGPAPFATIQVPTLLFSGPLSPILHPLTQVVFDTVPAGPPVVAYADLRDASHGTFSDTCEVPDEILEPLAGGPVPDCGPLAIPWRYARHVIDYLALNFFDGVLNGDAEALARLDPGVLGAIEDLTYQSK